MGRPPVADTHPSRAGRGARRHDQTWDRACELAGFEHREVHTVSTTDPQQEPTRQPLAPSVEHIFGDSAPWTPPRTWPVPEFSTPAKSTSSSSASTPCAARTLPEDAAGRPRHLRLITAHQAAVTGQANAPDLRRPSRLHLRDLPTKTPGKYHNQSYFESHASPYSDRQGALDQPIAHSFASQRLLRRHFES